MYLTQHQTGQDARWALDGYFLPPQLNLGLLLGLPKAVMLQLLQTLPTEELATGELLAPLDPEHEVWACGSTYLTNAESHHTQTAVAELYTKIYAAPRPELFFKAIGWRVSGHTRPIRVRQDSTWTVPEPEVALVINRHQEIVGFCIANDVSSRSIESENPLYLPQAKIYNGSCALGPGIQLAEPEELQNLAIEMAISRANQVVFQGHTSTAEIKRPLEELVSYLVQELDFPYGGFLLSGTGIIPPPSFSLQAGDSVQITIGTLTLVNLVAG